MFNVGNANGMCKSNAAEIIIRNLNTLNTSQSRASNSASTVNFVYKFYLLHYDGYDAK